MTKRVFLAINIPDEIKQKLGPVIEELKKSNPDYGIKWVAAENLHLTLHFFGDLDEKQITTAEKGIWEITKRIESFEMKTGNFGCFPNEQSPHVFFASVGDSDAIHTLIGELEAMLENLGFEVDPRPWQGHLTLGRIKNWSNCKISSVEIPEMTFSVKSVELMKSELTPDGPVYSVIKSFSLK
ncbi:RNA 2',3'-cyclic phosphodiesterase [Patescibacteria group bacterium]|nr:RNA 2',3'-cyclic phosphodiesterase [Patescibacteria group bacterium]